MVVNITRHNFKQEIEESKKPIVIDFYATWCGPCQHMEPIFESLAKEYEDKYLFAKLKVDDMKEVASYYGITSVPTFVFIKDGKVLAKEIGYMSQDDLKEKIEEHFK